MPDRYDRDAVLVSTIPGREFLPSEFVYKVKIHETDAGSGAVSSKLGIMAMVRKDGALKPVHGTTIDVPTSSVTRESIVQGMEALTGYASQLTRIMRMREGIEAFGEQPSAVSWFAPSLALVLVVGFSGMLAPHGSAKGALFLSALLILSTASSLSNFEGVEDRVRRKVQQRLSVTIDQTLSEIPEADLQQVVANLSDRTREIIRERDWVKHFAPERGSLLGKSFITIALVCLGFYLESAAMELGGSKRISGVIVAFVLAPMLALTWAPNLIGDLTMPAKDPDQLADQVMAELRAVIQDVRAQR